MGYFEVNRCLSHHYHHHISLQLSIAEHRPPQLISNVTGPMAPACNPLQS